jgi:hypothetical protein
LSVNYLRPRHTLGFDEHDATKEIPFLVLGVVEPPKVVKKF